ncbi:MAG: sulfatase [Planctomycetaceae bacterium]|jgi:arylsulfatase A-like enzyme|nr:sulfatase [Planctomycetaceae bacterium]
MKRILFFVSIIVAVSVVSVIVSVPTVMFAAETKPNIVFIFTDDHAYQAIGVYGSNRNETPQMDKLASQGMRFTNCCVTNSLCGPSRAVIQTGKYSHTNGFKTNEDKFNINQPTFPKMLQKAGYQTAVVGKWHLVCDVQGYDYSEILIGQGPYYNPPMIRNGERVKHVGKTTEIITNLSLQWLEKRDRSKPFLLMVQHKAPHREWDAYPKYYNKYKNREFPYPETFNDTYSGRGRAALEQDMTIAETITHQDLKLEFPAVWNSMTDEQKSEWHEMYDGRKAEFETVKNDPAALKRWKYQCYMKDYLSCVAAADDSIGQLTEYLDKNGLAQNTVVVYASDQGFYLGEHGWFDKRFMYNESFKTPLIVRWHGVVQPDSVCNDIVSNVDFAETFLEMAGVPVPDDMQGRSFVPILKGQTPTDWRKSFYYHYYEYPAVHMVKRHEGVYDGRFKLIHFYNDIDEWEFYDLQTDPHELRNVIDDSTYSEEVDRLKTELERHKTELNVPPIEVNTKSAIFNTPFPEGRPGMKKMIERLRNNIEQRRKIIVR